MANGFSNEQMIELILEGQKELKADIKDLAGKVEHVISQGCAKRTDDILRVSKLEEWKDNTTFKFIGLLVGIIAAITTSIVAIFTPK